MGKSRIVRLTMLSALLLPIGSSMGQNAPTSGFYEIVSGQYAECCGLAPIRRYRLPNSSPGFVELTVDPERHLARMTFLAQDLQTIFSIAPHEPPRAFTFAFNNGIVLADDIQSEGPMPPPGSDQPYFSYAVSNAADTLSIHGANTDPILSLDAR